MKNKTFIKGAAILVICNLIGKVIGAVYRIPLAQIVGGVGMGQYQLVFPLYCLILTISTSGIPIAISKLVAEFNAEKRQADSKRLLKISLLILSGLSVFGALLVALGARVISNLQGNPSVYVCYYAIAPAIVFVGILSALRGYFQGNLLMFPTAVSGLIEQLVKMILGLLFATKLVHLGVEYAVLGALMGISISEFAACLFLAICYFAYSRKLSKNSLESSRSYRFLSKQLLSLSVPITLGGLVSPITSMVDSLLVVNLLMMGGMSNFSATTMLGLQSGVVEPLLNLPVVIAISLTTVLLPSLSSISKQSKSSAEPNGKYEFGGEVKSLIERTFQITLSISIACAICFVIFGSQMLEFLYGKSFRVDEIFTATKLLFLGSVNVLLLSLVQVTAGALQALGKPKYPVLALLAGCAIKVVLDIILIGLTRVGILGAAISGIVCYFVVLTLNYSKLKKLTGAKLIGRSYFYVAVQECFVCLFAYFGNILFKMFFSDTIAMFIAGTLSVAVFAITYYVFFMGNKQIDEQNIKILSQ